MNRRTGLIAAAFLVAAIAGIAARLFLWPGQPSAPAEQGPEDRPAAVAVTEELVLEPADLYFPSLQGGLRVHRQSLPTDDRPEERIRYLVQALIEGPGGPVDGDLYSPLPEGAQLGSVYFLKHGAVALDLRSRADQGSLQSVDSPEPTSQSVDSPGSTSDVDSENAEGFGDSLPTPRPDAVKLALGTQDELLAVYSLVNTVALNHIEGVETVVLMWDGRQPETFAGHIDVSRPLSPDSGWVITP